MLYKWISKLTSKKYHNIENDCNLEHSREEGRSLVM